MPAPTCTFNGQSFEEGAQITAFADSTVGFGKICNVEERLCAKGSFSGSFAYADCAVGLPASCLFESHTIPNGQTISSGQSVTALLNPSPAYGEACVSQTRLCTDGSLSGTNTQSSCFTQSAPVASCTVSVDKTNFSTTEYMTFTITSKEASNVQKNCWDSWHEMPLNGTKTYDPYTWSGKYTCRFRAINKHTFQPVDCNPTAVYLDVW